MLETRNLVQWSCTTRAFKKLYQLVTSRFPKFFWRLHFLWKNWKSIYYFQRAITLDRNKIFQLFSDSERRKKEHSCDWPLFFIIWHDECVKNKLLILACHFELWRLPFSLVIINNWWKCHADITSLSRAVLFIYLFKSNK